MAKANVVEEVGDSYKRAIEYAEVARAKGDDALERIYNGSLNHHNALAVAKIVDGQVNLAVAFCKAGI